MSGTEYPHYYEFEIQTPRYDPVNCMLVDHITHLLTVYDEHRERKINAEEWVISHLNDDSYALVFHDSAGTLIGIGFKYEEDLTVFKLRFG